MPGIRDLTMLLKRRACLLILLNCPWVAAQAGEAAVFTPPQAYPVARYEAGWNKNPFTLKTVTPVSAQGSFAKDLAIGAYYGAADNPTVVVVNTKTNERMLLRKDKPGTGGMSLKSVHLSASRSECQAEIMLGAEAAVITYDANYLGQLAANEASRTTAAPAKRPVALPPLPVPAVKVSNTAPPVPFAPAVPARNRFTLPSAPLPTTNP